MLVLYSAGRDSITRHVHHWHSISALSHEMTALPTSISSLDVMIPTLLPSAIALSSVFSGAALLNWNALIAASNVGNVRKDVKLSIIHQT